MDWHQYRNKLEQYKLPALKKIAHEKGIETAHLDREGVICELMRGAQRRSMVGSLAPNSSKGPPVRKDHLKQSQPARPTYITCFECDGTGRRGLLFGLRGLGMFKGPNNCTHCAGSGKLIVK